MATQRKKRALILTGAGASIEFGAPDTAKLSQIIKKKAFTDKSMRNCGSDYAYLEINKVLEDYLQDGASTVNFEHVYHCAHELLSTFEPTPGAVNEYRPILVPFLKRRLEVDEQALQTLVKCMDNFIIGELSVACEEPKNSLTPLTAFIAKLREKHVTRIYTTNYDDFLWQAMPDLYTGFGSAWSPEVKNFDLEKFWQATDVDSIFHLHGSVHLSFPHSQFQHADLDALHWFDCRAEALRYSSFNGSGIQRMDGGEIMRTTMISGLEKLSRLQQQPFSHYYASMARDAMMADIIYVIGSGLGDLHVNTWLGDARRMNPMPPLVFVDFLPNGFLDDTAFESNHKTTQMFHKLRMHVGNDYNSEKYGRGWTLAGDRSCAIWDKGFLEFLKTPGELEYVLGELTHPQPRCLNHGSA